MFEQDRVLVRLRQYILKAEQIKACFLAGSHGRGTNDKYSDLNLILIFSNEESRARVYEDRYKFVRSALPYLTAKSFDADHVIPYLHIALYRNGAKVDYLFETFNIKPRFQYQEMRVLKESDNWASTFLRDCAAQQQAVERMATTAELLSNLDDRFWIMLMDVYRRLLRGDHDTPYPIYLQMIYFTIPKLLELLPSEEPAHQALIDIRYTTGTDTTIKHLRRLLRAYLGAREAVVRRHQLNFPVDSAFERDILKKIERA